ncbi:hypothetical protein LJC49_07890 [Ruminococcaceae bacterium OttesenSCG-928-I18]|nr:hypothetical protein [Ruminococcaceae bacterium OttesenSCG-928-I18]
MKWLYKLEYRFGKYYIHNLMTIVVIGMAAVYIFDMAAANAGFSMSNLLSLERSAILSGQVWRVLTFVFVPTTSGAFWMLIACYFYYMIGKGLENAWGGFRMNVYYLMGMLGAIASCFIIGYGTNVYLNLSLFLAFATVAPDTTFMLFFILPVKAKWMALAYAAFLVIQLLFTFIGNPMLGLISLVSLGFSLLNYFIFFGGTMFRNLKEQIRISQNRRNWRNR